MSQLTTLGWRMEIRLWRGLDGIRIPESGSAVRTCRGVAASESAGSEVMDGAGITGDSIGAADTQCTAAAGTTLGATRFITAAISTGQEAHAAVTVCGAEPDPVPMLGTGPLTETLQGEPAQVPVPAQRPGLSTETPRLHEATRHLAAKAAFAPARLADTTTADRPGATPREAAPAWARRMPAEDLAAVVEVRTAAVAIAAAGTGNRSSYTLLSLDEYEMERSNATHHPELRSPLSRDLS